MSQKNGHSQREKWVKTKLELAQLLGISRTTLDNFITLPGFPARAANGHLPLEACRAFVAAHLGRSEERRGLELQKMRDDLARGQLELMKAAGEVIPLDWSRRMVAHLAISTRNVIEGSDLSDEQKQFLSVKIEAIDVDGFLAELKKESGLNE